jgi:putative ABC transport system permease protein
MLSPRWRKMYRDMWLHRTRSILAILAMVVGLAGAGSVLDTWALLGAAIDEGYRATNPPSAVLHLDGAISAAIAAAKTVPGVRYAEGRQTLVVRAFVKGAWQTATLFASPSLGRERIGIVSRESGQFPAPPRSLTLESSSVEFSGLAIGDSVILRGADRRTLTLPISGIAQDRGLAPGWMEHVVYGFVGSEDLEVLGGPQLLSQLRIAVADTALDRANIGAVAAKVKEVIERRGGRVTRIEVPEPGEHVHAGQMNSLLMIQGAFGTLALILSAFLMVNLMTALLSAQEREIGIMKTLGAQPRDLVVMFLAFAVVLGLISTVIAVPVAALMARPYAALAAGLLNFSVDGYRIPPYVIVLQIAAGSLLPLSAAVVPVLSATKRSVADALRAPAIALLPEWLTRYSAPDWVTRPLLLSTRNALRQTRRLALTVATLALGGAVFMAALALRSSVRDSVANLYENLMRFDGVVRLASSHPPGIAEARIAAVPGVRAVEAWNSARAAIVKRGQMQNAFGVTGVPPSTTLLQLPPSSGRWLHEGDGRVLVVSRELLHSEPELAVGRTVSLVIGGTTAEWLVIGVVPMLGRVAYADRGTLSSMLSDPGTVALAVAARPGFNKEPLFQTVRAVLDSAGLDVASIQVMATTRAASEDHVLMVVDFLLVVAQLTILVAALGLASTMSIAVLERTREIGVLRAIGAAPGAVIAIVEREGLVIAAISVLVAVPLSVPMTYVLGQAFGRVMFPVPPRFTPPATAFVVWAGTAIVVAAAACLWPAWQATRITVAKALAYE